MEEVVKFFFTQGILGVICIILGIVVVRLYAEIKALSTKNETLQEARRLDAIQTRDAVTSILPGISQSLENISAKIEISKQRSRRD